jgi:hypothetical protein
MRRIQRHQRREAITPVGDGIQRMRVGGWIGIEHQQIRTDGAGIGQWQADLETEMGCGIIQRGNLQRVVLFGDDDARFFANRYGAVAREPALDTVGGQARQPQAEDTPPVY